MIKLYVNLIIAPCLLCEEIFLLFLNFGVAPRSFYGKKEDIRP